MYFVEQAMSYVLHWDVQIVWDMLITSQWPGSKATSYSRSIIIPRPQWTVKAPLSLSPHYPHTSGANYLGLLTKLSNRWSGVAENHLVVSWLLLLLILTLIWMKSLQKINKSRLLIIVKDTPLFTISLIQYGILTNKMFLNLFCTYFGSMFYSILP